MASQAKQDLETAFNNMDTNGDGFVTGKELAEYIKKLPAYQKLSPSALSKKAAELITLADKNTDGKLSKAEFLSANNDLLQQL